VNEQKAERYGAVTVFEPVKTPEKDKAELSNKWRSWLEVAQSQGFR